MSTIGLAGGCSAGETPDTSTSGVAERNSSAEGADGAAPDTKCATDRNISFTAGMLGLLKKWLRATLH